ncbi:MAG: hypothetical protein CME66_08240 [Halobacteriovoraceae bacterium]|nr:hypothetical protein [Halobacteriovoraceae bacterium]|tara:strand:- start:311 stop:967 length:657 start_codon:yes stop_codon:yes gene_type:complete
MLQQEISKSCAESLRQLTQDTYKIKLKSSHAHELVAAYLGYASKNVMIADQKFNIANISRAKIFVLVPEVEIDNRRRKLAGISNSLPDSYQLGEAVYSALFSNDQLYKSDFPPFRTFLKFAKHYIENSEQWKNAFKVVSNHQLDHIFDFNEETDFVKIIVTHTSNRNDGTYLGLGKTTVILPRVVGKIGFLEPKMNFEKWSGKERKIFAPSREKHDVK